MSAPVTCAFFLLVSLALPPSAEGSGEYCHEWSDSFNTWHRGFHCPERYDGEEARYCCGTCALRYCCTSAEARLDQSSCDQDELADFKNNDKVMKMTPNVPMYLPFVIVVSAFLSFVLIGIVVSVCCCQCLKPKAGEGHARAPPPLQASLLESGLTPNPESMTPSRSSNSSASSTTRPAGSEVTVSMYGPLGNGVPGSGQYSPAGQMGQFYQPYLNYSLPNPNLNYSLPPEHNLAPTFLDSRSVFGQSHGRPFLQTPIGQSHGQPFAQAPMHTEPLYRASPSEGARTTKLNQ